MMARTVRFGALLALLAVAACDSGPSGPGALVVRVSGPSLGGALIDVSGSGIQGFAGRGSTQAYGASVGVGGAAHRVLLIDPNGTEIVFEILVDDLGMEGPTLTVVSATGVDNSTQLVSGVSVLVER